MERADTQRQASSWQVVELAAIFLALPVTVALVPSSVQPLWILGVLAVAAGWFLVRRQGVAARELVRLDGDRRSVAWLLAVWLASALLLVLAVDLWRPAQLFAMPRHRPAQWLELLALYPFVSVVPQEVLYRAFFFRRYRALFGEGGAALLANAALFALAHVVFHNAVAIVLTFIGGLLFASTYRKSGSLTLVSIQHVLYGWTVFSVGLEPFFLGGTLHR